MGKFGGGQFSFSFQINTEGRLLRGVRNPPPAGKGGGGQSGNAPSPSPASTPPAPSRVGRVHPVSQAQHCEESPRERERKPALAAPEARCVELAPNRAGRTQRTSHFPHRWKSLPLRIVPAVARGSGEVAPVQEKLPIRTCRRILSVLPSGAPGRFAPPDPWLSPGGSSTATRTALGLRAQKRATVCQSQPLPRLSLSLPPPTQEVSVLLEQ